MPAAERLSDESFLDLDRRTYPRDWPEPEPRAPAHVESWVRRTLHFLETDPGGCWVAEDDSGMVGMSTSFVRDKTWCLATYAVRPGLQSRGIGKQLLAASMHHGRGCLRGMLSGSADPKAARRYRLAGFSLHPQMFLTGTVDRSAIPVVEKVREGAVADTELMDSIDRRVREAAHGPDHPLMQCMWRLDRLRHHDRLGLRLPRREGPGGSAGGDQPAYGVATAVGGASPTAAPSSASPMSPPPTSGRSTSASRPGSTSTPAATSPCAG